MAKKHPQSYNELISAAPQLKDLFVEEQWDFMQRNNDGLRKTFEKLWKSNLRANCQGLFSKHKTITDDCVGIGLNKAVIAIGAGPSFNRNKDLLKELYDRTITLPFQVQPFIFMASNHQYKPLLEMGIAPHFVVVLDGTDIVYDQLCKNIPKHGRGTVLICPLRAHQKVLKEWDKQGRSIRFYISDNEWMMEEFEKVMGYSPKEHGMVMGHGGNVMNQTFSIAVHFLKSTIYMCVGNDLSYEYFDDLEDRRSGYYADKDYSTNIGTGRDEANRSLPWMGFELEESIIMPGRYVVRFRPRATTYQLMLYKTWVENQLSIQAQFKAKFHYYNCSESGILGVMSRKNMKELAKEEMINVINDGNNWYMLDELIPKRYHTRTLAHACNEFLTARERLNETWERRRGILTSADPAEASAAETDTARNVALN